MTWTKAIVRTVSILAIAGVVCFALFSCTKQNIAVSQAGVATSAQSAQLATITVELAAVKKHVDAVDAENKALQSTVEEQDNQLYS